MNSACHRTESADSVLNATSLQCHVLNGACHRTDSADSAHNATSLQCCVVNGACHRTDSADSVHNATSLQCRVLNGACHRTDCADSAHNATSLQCRVVNGACHRTESADSAHNATSLQCHVLNKTESADSVYDATLLQCRVLSQLLITLLTSCREETATVTRPGTWYPPPSGFIFTSSLFPLSEVSRSLWNMNCSLTSSTTHTAPRGKAGWISAVVLTTSTSCTLPTENWPLLTAEPHILPQDFPHMSVSLWDWT